MTGINIGDMIKIIEEHGLVPIPIDLDPYTMAPKLSQLKAATTSRTKACLFAYLYGVTYDIEPYVDFLKSKNIEIIEDCAQSWRGLDTFRGNKNALMTMFSFGSIKYNTAFYGAVTIVREKAPQNGKDQLLVDNMKDIQSHYSQLCLNEYVSKIKKTYLLGLSLTNKALVWSFRTYFERFRREDIEEFTVKRMRGFPPGDNFL